MHRNEIPNDELLEFVFGELGDTRQAALRKAIAEDAELAAKVDGLSSAVAAVRGENPGQLGNDFNERLRQRMPEILCPVRTETARPIVLTRSLTTWRWIMRSPVSRVAAAAILVLAMGGVAVWFHAGGTTPAFADYVKPILEAKTVKYKMTAKMTSLSADMKLLPAEMQKDLTKKAALTVHVTLMATPDGYRSRNESQQQNGSKKVEITFLDKGQGKKLTLDPAKKQATIQTFANVSKDKKRTHDEQDPMAQFRSLLLDTKDKPGIKRESLGEKEIDGRRVVGFRLSGRGVAEMQVESVMTLWGDPKTGSPVRIETTMPTAPGVTITMSDFEFNVAIDESLLSLEPPPGYEVVQGPAIDFSPKEEKDLIDALRYYTALSGGPFPALLDDALFSQKATTMKWTSSYREKPNLSLAKRQAELSAGQEKIHRGLAFIQLLPPDADAHYAGRGVSLGAADKPIFWYRPQGAKQYRVVYGDLSIHDAATPPNVAVSLPDPEPNEKDLIETLRCYSEASGGPFPNMLDLTTVALAGAMRQEQEKGQEIGEGYAKLQRGLKFTVSLPPDADVHYAGKGVSRGAADKPIFWYRSKNAKQYRVIYADLSVRNAAAPPNPPVEQPEDDLIGLFRQYSKLCNGHLPVKLEINSLSQNVAVKLFAKMPAEEAKNLAGKHEQNTQQLQKELMKFIMQAQPGLTFTASLPKDADVHYAGKGVSLGAAEKPIFWYRPKDSQKYRVIYADLSVRDADTPPSMPFELAEQDLIDALRHYSKLSDGPFPNSMDAQEWEHTAVLKRFHLSDTGGKSEEGKMPNEEQKRQLKEMQEFIGKHVAEIVESNMTFQSATTFMASLPPKADTHYAGKGVSLGAADRPIFWYRPKDAKKYRLIYADLSVRDADAPPKAPNAQPVPKTGKAKK
jgi:outer membrane lipoprotein-sorting protein